MSERLHFEVTADEKAFLAAMMRTQASIRNTADNAEKEGQRMEATFKKLTMLGGGFLTLQGVKSFAQEMFRVRSEFQDTESSMTVFLGSAARAKKFVDDLKDYAWYNMFEFSDLSKESAKLLAFGNDVERVIPILDMLSNIASATKKPLTEYIDLYNKAKNVGKVDASGLESWGTKGVVITDVLKEMGMEVDRSNIKFEHLEAVLKHVTDEGGMFHGLMAQQMENLSSSYGQLQDNIANMLNEIGERSQEALKSGIDAASFLVDNYEAIGKIIATLIATYGVYRAAVIVATIAESGWTISQLAHFKALVLVEKAQKILNATMLSNPYVAVAALLGMLVTSLILFSKKGNDAADAMKRFSDETESAKTRYEELISIVVDDTKAIADRQAALEQLRALYPSLFSNMDIEAMKTANQTTLTKELAEAERERQRVLAQERINDINMQISTAEADLRGRGAAMGAIGKSQAKAKIEQLKQDRAAQQEIIKQIDDDAAAAKKREEDAKREAANAPKNKNYWQKIKDDAEAARNALDVAKKGSAEWNEYTRQITEADKNLKAFSTSDKGQNDALNAKKAYDKAILDSDISLQQSRIDILKNGRVKDLAEIELTHKQKLARIEQDQKDLEEAYKKAGKGSLTAEDLAGFSERTKNATKERDNGVYDVAKRYGDELTEVYRQLGDVFSTEEERKRAGIKKTYDDLRKWAKEWNDAGNFGEGEYAAFSIKVDEAESRASINDAMEQFKTFATKRAEIEVDYNAKITALRKAGHEAEAREGEKQRDSAIAELDATMQASTTLWAQLFDNYSNYTNKELQTIIANAREVLAYVNSTTDADITPKFGLTAEQLKSLKSNATELAAAYDALDGKLKQLNSRNPFATLFTAPGLIKKAVSDLSEAEKELTAAQKTGDKEAIKNADAKVKALKQQRDLLKGDLKESALSAVGYLGDVGGSLQQIGEAAGDAGLASFGKTLGELSDIAGKFISGDIIGGAISAITTGLTAIFSSKAKYRAALKQMYDDQAAFVHEYALIMSDIRIQAEEASNAFGDDAIVKAISALKEFQRVYSDFIASINNDDAIKAAGNSLVGAMKQAQIKAKGITTDLQNIWIQTRNATWFRSAKGKYLKDMYPELFEGENGFNVEAAKALLATNNQLNDEAKRQLQEVIDLYDQWKEAESAFKDYLSSTFGELGSGLGDSIVNAFKNGTDAMEEWGESFNNVLENLGKQLMQTLFFQKAFDNLEDELAAIYGKYDLSDTKQTDKLGAEIQARLGSFFAGMEGTVNIAEEWYQAWADQASKYGFDLSGGSKDAAKTQTASSRGFQAMSQDTGDELNGRFTAIQMNTADIKTIMNDLKGLYLISINHLSGIEKNTKLLNAISEGIEKIRKNTENL